MVGVAAREIARASAENQIRWHIRRKNMKVPSQSWSYTDNSRCEMSSFSHRLLMIAAAALAAGRAGAAESRIPTEVPWKIHQTIPAAYPPKLMQHGVTHGEAQVRLSISASGQLTDALVTACTFREFGIEALHAVKEWKFEPARVNGEPVGVVGDIVFEFQVNGPVAIEKRIAAANDDTEEKLNVFAYRAEGSKRLDNIPTPTHLVPPVYPKEWSDRGIAGHATVEFFIDETGRARVPVAITAAHPLLAAAGVAAVSQWTFEPPKRDGKPVLARIQQDFNFEPQP
jgi:TonB family protein